MLICARIFAGCAHDNVETQPVDVRQLPSPKAPQHTLSSPELSSEVKRFAYQEAKKQNQSEDQQDDEEKPKTTKKTPPAKEEDRDTKKETQFSDDDEVRACASCILILIHAWFVALFCQGANISYDHTNSE